MNLSRLLNNKIGVYFISIILGLGLATLLKTSCDGDCIIYKAPNIDEISNGPYKYNNDCYNYEFNPGSCDEKKRVVSF
jgi:hypothetical protein